VVAWMYLKCGYLIFSGYFEVFKERRPAKFLKSIKSVSLGSEE
jgi:hypothetical protein